MMNYLSTSPSLPREFAERWGEHAGSGNIVTVNPTPIRVGEPAHSDCFEAFSIGGFTASYRILDVMLQATSPQTAVAVIGGAQVIDPKNWPGM